MDTDDVRAQRVALSHEELVDKALEYRDKVVESTNSQARSRDSITSLATRLKQVRQERHELKEELARSRRRVEDQNQIMIGMAAMAQFLAVALASKGEEVVLPEESA